MLQSGLLDITVNSKSLANLHMLELSHNSVSPTQTVHLALNVGNISSLRALLFGGVVFEFQENFYCKVFQVHHVSKHVQRHILHNNGVSTDDNKIVATFCLEIWRFWFSNRIKLCYRTKNNFPAFSHNMLPHNFVNNMLNLNPTLAMANYKQLEQKLSQLDAKIVTAGCKKCN